VGGNSTALTAVLANGTAGIGDLSGGAAPTAASGNFVLTGNPADGNTVTIGTQTYTFTSAVPTAANQVMLGGSITDTLNNLKAAVDGLAGAGTTYGTGTAANTQATITSVVGNQAVITANSSNMGVSGDSIALSANLSNGTGGGTVGTIGSKLSGGGASVDLNSPLDAQTALTTIAAAISTVAGQRGAIGSGINQMNAALSVMTNTSQNLTSSLSGIQDADIGKVVANMSKFQVLEQTGISALAQSNSQAQAVLKLLQ
jgi:flagellin